MSQETHDRLFKNIEYNVDPSFTWKQADARPAYLKGISQNYESRVEARIRQARHINNLDVSEGGGGAGQ